MVLFWYESNMLSVCNRFQEKRFSRTTNLVSLKSRKILDKTGHLGVILLDSYKRICPCSLCQVNSIKNLTKFACPNFTSLGSLRTWTTHVQYLSIDGNCSSLHHVPSEDPKEVYWTVVIFAYINEEALVCYQGFQLIILFIIFLHRFRSDILRAVVLLNEITCRDGELGFAEY